MKKLLAFVLASTAIAFAMPASAQFAKAEDAIKYRKSALFVMQQNFGRLAAMAAGRAPFDAKVAADNAEIVSDMAKLPWAAFAAGTEKGAIPTRAKPELFAQPAKFKEYSEKLIAESTKLSAAAKTGNADTLKAAFGATAGSCKACHDDFQAKL